MKLVIDKYTVYGKKREGVHIYDETKNYTTNSKRNFEIVEYNENNPDYDMIVSAAAAIYRSETSDYVMTTKENTLYQICDHVWYNELIDCINMYYAGELTLID
jgi:hypothetical protein